MKQNVQKKSNNTKPTKVVVKGKRKRKTSAIKTEKFEQGPGPEVQVDEDVINKQENVDNLSKQYVLYGRVFDMNIVHRPGMDFLYDIVEIQS